MKNVITLDNVRSYKSEENLKARLAELGLDKYRASKDQAPMRYIVTKTAEDRWTAVFLVSEHFKDGGGYMGVAARHGFMSI